MVSPVVIFFIILVSLPLICKFVLKLIVIHTYVKLYNFHMQSPLTVHQKDQGVDVTIMVTVLLVFVSVTPAL